MRVHKADQVRTGSPIIAQPRAKTGRLSLRAHSSSAFGRRYDVFGQVLPVCLQGVSPLLEFPLFSLTGSKGRNTNISGTLNRSLGSS